MAQHNAITNHTIGTGWTAIDTDGSVPVTLENISDEAMTIRLGEGGSEYALASGETLRRIPAYATCEAQCTSGGKVLVAHRGTLP